MALMLPHSIFFHIPKTGGTWVREAIKNAGISTQEVGASPEFIQNKHNRYVRVDRAGKFTFAFVRHPLTWYSSFWSYRMEQGWKQDDPADPFLGPSFEGFVRRILRGFPGHVSWRYEHYIGPEPGVLDFVGKMENLAADLVKALRLAGEEFDEQKILSTPRQHESRLRPVYSDRLKDAVLKSEQRGLKRFGYA